MTKRALTPEQIEAKRLRTREYNSRPEVKARKAEYQNRPEVKAKAKEYYNRPEVKARYKERASRGDQKGYMKEWRQSESGKRMLKAAGLRQRGWTLELWETMMSLQGGKCAICNTPFPENFRLIHADHCHDTNEPRGLLCQHCNQAEGHIRKTGLTPAEFGRRLNFYLGNPPVAQVGSEEKTLERNEKC